MLHRRYLPQTARLQQRQLALLLQQEAQQQCSRGWQQDRENQLAALPVATRCQQHQQQKQQRQHKKQAKKQATKLRLRLEVVLRQRAPCLVGQWVHHHAVLHIHQAQAANGDDALVAAVQLVEEEGEEEEEGVLLSMDRFNQVHYRRQGLRLAALRAFKVRGSMS